MACVIQGCTSHSGRKERTPGTITFHRFPKDEKLKKKWITLVNRKNWTWKNYCRLCSKHFTSDAFEPNENVKRRRLKDGALPTLHLTYTDILDTVFTPTIGYDTSAGPAPDSMQPDPTIYRWQQKLDIVRQGSQQLNVPPKSLCGTRNMLSVDSVRDQKERTILRLQQELEREKKISRRRLRKINTLTKRVSRLEKKTDELYTILLNRANEENVEIETEYITIVT